MKIFLLILSLFLASCATIPPPANPEIDQKIKSEIQNNPIKAGYSRYFICGGGLQTITNLGKSKSSINKNGIYEVRLNNELVAKFNQNEVVVIDFKETATLTLFSPNYRNIKTTLRLVGDKDKRVAVFEINRIADTRNFNCLPGFPCEINFQLVAEQNLDLNYCSAMPIVGYKVLP